jgi:nucleoside-diphosphate-sugar epimerase
MAVIVTGAAGFVGRHTVAELRRRGHAVVAVVRGSRGDDHPWSGDRGVRTVQEDLRLGTDAIAALLPDANAVIHLAASSRGTPRERFDATVLGTERLLELVAALRWRGRFVHVSSFAVCGFDQLRRGARVDENTPLECDLGRRDDYAWTKAWQERLVREAAARDEVDMTIVRPGAIYGSERRAQQRLGRPLGAHGLLLIGGMQVMPLTHVDNTASMLAECAVNPAASGETFHAVDPGRVRQWQYLRRWRAAGDGPRRVIPLPLPAFRAIGACYAIATRATGGAVRTPGMLDPYLTTPNVGRFEWDTDKAQRVLGWQPPLSRPAALDETFGGNHG